MPILLPIGYTGPMMNARKQVRRIVRNAAKDFGLGWRVPQAYRKAAKRPVDPRKVLFVEATLAELPDSFKAMFVRVDADPRFDATYVSLGKHRVDARTYLRNCEEFAREAATARIIFLNDASDVVSSLPLRPETRVVQLWHACGAFKRFGMSTANAGYGLSRADIERHPFYENLFLVTVSSPEVEWAYVEAMHLEGREGTVQALGVSRTDLFFDEAFHEQALRHLFEEVPAALDKRVVLYAPTYRGDLSCARAPELPDLVALKRALGDECIVLVKQHPMVRDLPPVPAECAGFAHEVSARLPIDELLVASDVLVTDYSSVVFEFSLFNRPMVFFAPDLDAYRDDRDFYYDFDAMTPGPVVSTSDELAACLVPLVRRAGREALADDACVQQVGAFRQLFMSACDGHATERILEATVGGQAGLPATLPRPGFRRGKIRRPHVRASRAAFNLCYRIANRRERRDEVVFISRQTDEPSYDFSALAREFEEHGWRATMHLKAVTERNLISYVRHVIVEIWLLGHCKVAIVDRYDPVISLLDFDCEPPARATNLNLAIGSSRETVNLDFPRKPLVLQVWHAFGSFKKFGYQSVGTPEAKPPDVFEDYRIHRNFTWVVCSGEQSRPAFAEAFSCPVERVVALNRPEFDELVALRRCLNAGKAHAGQAEGERSSRAGASGTAGVSDAAIPASAAPAPGDPVSTAPSDDRTEAHLDSSRPSTAAERALESTSPASPCVLMAPTRRFNEQAVHPFRDLYGHRESFEDRIPATFVWAFHPLDAGLPAPGNVSDTLIECDLLVTDYSSIVYEAYVLGKPTLFYIPDLDAYRSVPGLNCDPAELAPALCAYDEDELVALVATFANDPGSYPFDQYENFAARAFDYTIDELDAADIPPAAATIADFCLQAVCENGACGCGRSN